MSGVDVAGGGGAVDAEDVPVAQDICAGRFLLYGFHACNLGRFPDWHASPFDGAVAPAGRHWSKIPDFGFGDIKNIWESSRWGWAFALARAWRATGREEFAERFWELAEDWIEKNPPNSGANWKCGQETTFRLFAATYARVLLGRARATTPERLAQWRRLVVASGERIAANLDYALSQANNHGISECVGLLTAGVLDGGKIGRGWFVRGAAALERQVAELVYADGGFSQHSAVYHRVLLHDLLWAALVWQVHGEAVPVWLMETGARAARFLGALVDAETGQAHLYGANDGANVLPAPGYRWADFRFVARVAARVFLGQDWDSRNFAALHFPDAGVLLMRGACGSCASVSLLLRCVERFRHRATRDMLHLSAMWRGRPAMLNAGSFSYNASGRFAGGFANAFAQNTATAEGADQMERVGRFLFLPWPHGLAHWVEAGQVFEAVNFAYQARFGATHTRRISLREGGDGFVVEDVFEAAVARQWRLQWLLADGKLRLEQEKDGTHGLAQLRVSADGDAAGFCCRIRWESSVTAAVSPVRAAVDSARGWYAPHYQDAQSAWSLALKPLPTAHVRVRTEFSFSEIALNDKL
ncbi:MAG: heparinase II/III family protein [Puniceicoccales bacterium]|nr:heparinase II/III family protein [Puniceicoccales bacterium]